MQYKWRHCASGITLTDTCACIQHKVAFVSDSRAACPMYISYTATTSHPSSHQSNPISSQYSVGISTTVTVTVMSVYYSRTSFVFHALSPFSGNHVNAPLGITYIKHNNIDDAAAKQSSIRQLNQRVVRSFVRSFVHSFTHSFIHSLTHSHSTLLSRMHNHSCNSGDYRPVTGRDGLPGQSRVTDERQRRRASKLADWDHAALALQSHTVSTHVCTVFQSISPPE